MSCLLCSKDNRSKMLNTSVCKHCDKRFSKMGAIIATEHEWLDLLELQYSINAETKENFCEWIAQPVIRYNLSPRQARSILEIFGKFANEGINLTVIMKNIVGEVNARHK